MTPTRLAALFVLAGMALVVAGVGLVYLPAAIVLAGLLIVAVSGVVLRGVRP